MSRSSPFTLPIVADSFAPYIREGAERALQELLQRPDDERNVVILPHIFSQSTMLQVDATFSVNVERIREVYASIPNRLMNSSEESRLQSLECNILSAARELASDIVLSSGFVAPLAFFCLPQPKQKDVHGTDNGPSSITKAAEMLLSEWELGEDPNLRLHHGIPSHIDQAVGLQRNLPASGHTSPVAKESHRYPSESTSEAKSLPQQTFAPPVLSQSQHNLSQSSMYLPSRNLQTSQTQSQSQSQRPRKKKRKGGF